MRRRVVCGIFSLVLVFGMLSGCDDSVDPVENSKDDLAREFFMLFLSGDGNAVINTVLPEIRPYVEMYAFLYDRGDDAVKSIRVFLSQAEPVSASDLDQLEQRYYRNGVEAEFDIQEGYLYECDYEIVLFDGTEQKDHLMDAVVVGLVNGEWYVIPTFFFSPD